MTYVWGTRHHDDDDDDDEEWVLTFFVDERSWRKSSTDRLSGAFIIRYGQIDGCLPLMKVTVRIDEK